MSCTGKLEICAATRENKTIISNCYYEGALKVSRPIYLEEQTPNLYLIHIGGGYVDGDMYVTTLRLEEGAELIVTTQSSTKVYKTPVHPVLQRTHIELKKGSVLEYLPDPLICFEGSRFSQETIVHLDEDACFMLSDIITPGWAEDGSLFYYDWIRSKLKIFKYNRLVVYDHLWLQPDGEMDGILQLDGYTHIGTFLVIHNSVDQRFLDQVYEEVEMFHEDVRFGVSLLPVNGFIFRVLANRTPIIEQVMTHIHLFARQSLLGKNGAILRKY
ncbi:urease accessory protein UreD [Heyndrickxia ginsengihumi]|uniref:urease accessory protein UreD n=1 Tax=Heyndrickxia ginsengihumi TaxID=363870 RepID=UPI001D8D290C|nr:urease accessory protein UreD [Heyndrickxia ginsengihumi]MBE6184439.1 urease accessory protein UreD [Bacillus sp. (in: firmicutes)]MCM3024717.1 urease accessory protein UreD [Heyndrickxia ginsengihumi]